MREDSVNHDIEVINNGQSEILLAFEIKIERTLGNSRRPQNLLKAGGIETLNMNQFCSFADNFITGIGLCHF